MGHKSSIFGVRPYLKGRGDGVEVKVWRGEGVEVTVRMYLTDKPSHGRPILYPAPHKPLRYHTMGHGYDTRRIPEGQRRHALRH